MPQLGETVPEGTVTRRPRHVHSPRVRRLAAQAGLALDSVRGTGPGGRVTTSDLAAALAKRSRSEPAVEPAPQPPPVTEVDALGAERTIRSPGTAAQSTSVVEADVTRVVALRRETAPELTLTAFFAKAVLEALRAYPVLNASIGDDGRTVTYHRAQHLGIAVDTSPRTVSGRPAPKGLMVPVVRHAGDLSLHGLNRQIEDLATRTRSGSLAPDDLTGGTFTLTDTGSRGVLFDTPILVPGQVGILATGAVVERPAVVRRPDGERVIAIRSSAYLALTYDHRLVDGADAARFLVAVKDRLERGQFHTGLG